MTLDRQTKALLALIEADRAQKCAAIDADARARCAAILREAHADARARMRAAFAEERAHRDLRVAAAQATLQTRLRLALQHRSSTFLAAGWRRLPRALDARWADAAARASWVDAIVAAGEGRAAERPAPHRLSTGVGRGRARRAGRADRPRVRQRADACRRSRDHRGTAHHRGGERHRRHAATASAPTVPKSAPACSTSSSRRAPWSSHEPCTDPLGRRSRRPRDCRGPVRDARSRRGRSGRAARRSRAHRGRRDRRAGLRGHHRLPAGDGRRRPRPAARHSARPRSSRQHLRRSPASARGHGFCVRAPRHAACDRGGIRVHAARGGRRHHSGRRDHRRRRRRRTAHAGGARAAGRHGRCNARGGDRREARGRDHLHTAP